MPLSLHQYKIIEADHYCYEAFPSAFGRPGGKRAQTVHGGHSAIVGCSGPWALKAIMYQTIITVKNTI
jgi:hypothetical protein